MRGQTLSLKKKEFVEAARAGRVRQGVEIQERLPRLTDLVRRNDVVGWDVEHRTGVRVHQALRLGLDVPRTAVLRDALVSAAIPDPSIPVVPEPS